MSGLRREHGFTLIEGLVAMACAVIVFGATLTILEVYMRQSTAVTQRFDAQNQARVAVDRIVRQLRNVASPLTVPKLLERATPYDLVFQTIGNSSTSNPSGTERVRYCIPSDTSSGSSSKEELIAQTQTVATSSNDPWSSDPSVTIACPDTTFAPSVSTDPQYTVVASSVVNRRTAGGYTTQNLFDYNNGLDSNQVATTDLPDVSTIQINMLVNPTPSVLGATTQIQSSAYLRNKEHQPIATFSPSYTGSGGVVLNGGASYSPDGEQLSYAWSCTTGCSASASSSLQNATDGLVPWQPGAGTYTVQLIVTDENDLESDPYTQTITVT
jgi:type II secretory pathway pseudopilin PulG